MKTSAFMLGALLALGAAHAGSTAKFEKALKLKKEGKHAPAAEAFAAIVSAEPKNVGALEQLATLQGWLGKHDAALATWRKALKLAPDNSDLRLGLARVLYWKGDRKQALSELADVLDAQPESVEAWTLQGDIQLAADQVAAARKAYLKAKDLSPDDAELDKKLERTAPSKK